jgi:hypothetical protein
MEDSEISIETNRQISLPYIVSYTLNSVGIFQKCILFALDSTFYPKSSPQSSLIDRIMIFIKVDINETKNLKLEVEY